MEFFEQHHTAIAPTRFVEELNRIVTNSEMSLRQIAGDNTHSQLSRALQGTLPQRMTLIRWCQALYRQNAITEEEANTLLGLAGYNTPKQYEEAVTGTTAHRAIVKH